MRSTALDDAVVPAPQVIPDELVIGLELVSLDGVWTGNVDDRLPPSSDNDLNIDLSQEKSTFGLQASGIKTREKISAPVPAMPIAVISLNPLLSLC